VLDKGSAGLFHRLGDLAEIQLGYAFRSSVETEPGSDYRLVQLKDAVSATLDETVLTCIPNQDWNENYLIKPGDLVFRSRNGNFGFIQIPDTESNLVLAAPLFRVRVNRSVLRPEFLLWFASLDKSQEYFAKNAEGTAQKMINRKGLEDFPISLVDVEIQKKFIGIISLQNREASLASAILVKRRFLIQGVLRKLLNDVSDLKT